MSEWAVVISHDALKTLNSFSRDQKERLWAAIRRLSNGLYNETLDVKRLHGSSDWRLRVGRWRVIFRVDHGNITILVVSVSPRGDAYK